jgi:hypothetical protein
MLREREAGPATADVCRKRQHTSPTNWEVSNPGRFYRYLKSIFV